MIPKQLYYLLLVLAIGLITLQLSTGIWLFILKYGLSPAEVLTYFSGNEELFIMKKSFEGLLETAVPHFMAISLSIFVYAHFLLFTKIISQRQKQLIIFGLFFFASVDIFSPFLIIYGFEIFAWFKVIAFWSFEMLMAGLLYTLFLVALRARITSSSASVS